MEHPDTQAAALTSFDPVTADAVVAVLSRHGIAAWQDPEPDDHGDVVVKVPADLRAAAMRTMGQQMDAIQAEVRAGSAHRAPQPPPPRPLGHEREASDGPPLTMERFADMRLLVVVVLLPLLVITVAGPFLPRAARIVIFLALAVGLAVLLRARRR